MSIRQSRTPYDQDILPDLTQATSAELQRHKARVQEEARLAEEARLEAERQEQAQLEEERARAEAEAQRLEAARKAEEARKEAESQRADALVSSSTGAGPNVEVMSPRCLRCARTNMPCLRSTDSKKKHMACNRCNELKEHCRWPVEGEAGAGLAGDQGKRKPDVMSPRVGEKKKRLQHPSAKVTKGAGDEEDNVEEGPSTKKTGAETGAGPVTGDQRKKRFPETSTEVPSDWDTTDEEDREVEGLDDELEGLREEEEESRSWSESGDQASAGSAGSQV
ncbi:hypothetical protein M404DRAFT_29509 [Pisolithus tinctorius Marx 270]|uniref:Zn(2)-C6 fungal-type domain-containing protein n=1 Tax=Pisolithus tinctorius Marx 270 TaxID=870435 RepID=A0A0C3NZ63_PISTI|nr:hypothetical protein M404DRAFT_29509 [Pisolithus tinctorius Marx 270]